MNKRFKIFNLKSKKTRKCRKTSRILKKISLNKKKPLRSIKKILKN